MKKMTLTTTALFLVGLGAISPLAGQNTIGLEIRGNGAISTQDTEREYDNSGFGFEANLQYRFHPNVSAYAGWDWARFSALESIAGPDMDIHQTGYVLGLRYDRPFSETSRTAWWVRLGGIYDHMELKDGDGDAVDDSGHGFGAEAGAGVVVPLGEYWSLTPGLRYRKISRDLTVEGTDVPVTMESLAFELGIGFHF